MAFANAQNTSIFNSAFTDIQGDVHSYYSGGGNISINRGEGGLRTLLKAVSTGAAYNSRERHPPPKCHARTRQETLAEIEGWISSGPSSNTGNLMWLHGPAGAGKSAISQTISESSANRGELAASFFFSREKPGRDSSHLFFTTIALQLALSVPMLREAINRTVEADPLIIHKAAALQFQKLLVEPLQSKAMGVEGVNQQPPFLVVIDGLDECKGNSDQSQILMHIMQLSHTHSLSIPLSFLVVSRPEPHIHHAFTEPSIQGVKVRLVSLYGDYRTSADIHAFLQDSFQKIHDSEKHSYTMQFIPKPWPSVDTLKSLVSKSSGYFIYASTVLKFVDEEYFSPVHRLAEVMDTLIPSPASSSAPFAELDKLYDQILSTCPNKRLLGRILRYILTPFAQPHTRPTISTMEAIFDLHPGDVRLSLRGLHSLVSITSLPGTPDFQIHSYHASLADYIFDKDRSGEFFIDTDSHLTDIVLCSCRFFNAWSARLAQGNISEENWRHIVFNLQHHFTNIQDKSRLFEELNATSLDWEHLINASIGWSVSDQIYILETLDTVIHEVLKCVPPSNRLIIQLRSMLNLAYTIHLSPYRTELHFIHGMFTMFSLGDSHWQGMLEETCIRITSFLGSPYPDKCLHWSLCTYLQRAFGRKIRLGPPDAPQYIASSSFADFLADPAQSHELYAEPQHARLAQRCIEILTEIWSSADAVYLTSFRYKYSRRNWVAHLSHAQPGEQGILECLGKHDPGPFFVGAELDTLFSPEKQKEMMPCNEYYTYLHLGPLPDAVGDSRSFYQSPRERRKMINRLVIRSIVNLFPEQPSDEAKEYAEFRARLRDVDIANAKRVVEWLKKAIPPPSDLILKWEKYCRESYHLAC